MASTLNTAVVGANEVTSPVVSWNAKLSLSRGVQVGDSRAAPSTCAPLGIPGFSESAEARFGQVAWRTTRRTLHGAAIVARRSVSSSGTVLENSSVLNHRARDFYPTGWEQHAT
jgi:hypothetical protein